MGCNTSVNTSLGFSSEYFLAGLICCRAAWTNQSVNENKLCQIILMMFFFFNHVVFLVQLVLLFMIEMEEPLGVFDCWSGKKRKAS